MLRRLVVLLLALALLGVAPAAGAAPAPAPVPAAPSPASSGADPARAERPEPAVVALRRLARRLAAGGVGVTAEVRVAGRVLRMAAGRSSVRPRTPARADARFRAASVSKQLTAVMALQMVQRGRWTLGTTLGEVLPGLWPERASVTLRQLLSHTSGLPDYLPALLTDVRNNRDFIRAISRVPDQRGLVRVARGLEPLFEPGAAFGYSNTNFLVVGMMLARATGTPLPQLVRSRVLRPAGMTGSSWPTGPGMALPRLREYARLGGLLPLNRFDPDLFSGAGALVSTAEDLNRFRRALGAGKLVNRRLLAVMRRPVPQTLSGEVPAPEYGLGSYRLPDPCVVQGGRDVRLHGHDGLSYGTATLSFGRGTSARDRVTVAVTGRPFTLKGLVRQQRLLSQFVNQAFLLSCLQSPAARRALPQPVSPLPDYATEGPLARLG